MNLPVWLMVVGSFVVASLLFGALFWLTRVRVFGAAAASPLTFIGLFFALVGWTRFVSGSEGALEFVAKPGGLVAWVFLKTRTCGASWGHVIFYEREATPLRTKLHERRHVYQAMCLGIAFLPVYALCSLVALLEGKGLYWGNALEVDARKAEVI